MNHVKIELPKDYLIIEKINGDTIQKGSHIYCGCCGHSVGTLKTRLSFPFFSDKLLKKLEGCDLVPHVGYALIHNKCGSSLFLLQKGLSFITLDKFNEFQALIKEQNKDKTKLLN